MASRECGKGGEWGAVEGSQCTLAPDTTQSLITIIEVSLLESHHHHTHTLSLSSSHSPACLQTDVTASNIESVSAHLSSALSPPSSGPLSLDEVEVVLDIVEELITFTGVSITVRLMSVCMHMYVCVSGVCW